MNPVTTPATHDPTLLVHGGAWAIPPDAAAAHEAGVRRALEVGHEILARGGAAFADWFAEDGVALGNGQQPAIGRVAIMKSSNWDPKLYQLTWTPTEAVLGPSGDIGYTWGHFEGHSKDANGNPVTTSGRYITIWRKQPNGAWKVVLDAGANEPAAAGDCCKVTP